MQRVNVIDVTKRALACLACALMLCGAFAVCAFADEVVEPAATDDAVEIEAVPLAAADESELSVSVSGIDGQAADGESVGEETDNVAEVADAQTDAEDVDEGIEEPDEAVNEDTPAGEAVDEDASVGEAVVETSEADGADGEEADNEPAEATAEVSAEASNDDAVTQDAAPQAAPAQAASGQLAPKVEESKPAAATESAAPAKSQAETQEPATAKVEVVPDVMHGETPMTAAAPPVPKPIDTGVYVIKTGLNGAHALAVADGARTVGAGICQQDVDGTYDQLFYLEKLSSDTFSIFSVLSGLALSFSGGEFTFQAYTGVAGQQFTIKASSDGAWTLATSDNRLITMNDASGKAGVGISATPKSGTARQDFRLVSAAMVVPGVHALFSTADPTGALAATSAGAVVQESEGMLDEKYLVARSASGDYSVCSMVTGKYLAMVGDSVANSDSPFYWEVSMLSTGGRRSLVFQDPLSGKALVTPAGANGTAVGASTYADKATYGILPSHVDPLDSGRYAILNDGTNRALSVRDDSWDAGAGLQVRENANSGGQVFDIANLGFGLFSINNAMTSLAVSSWGSDVQQRNADGGSAQQWYLCISPNGALTFACVADLNALAGGTSNGAAATMAANNGSAVQRWRVTYAEYTPDPVLVRAQSMIGSQKSQTAYYIAVDLTASRTMVFYGSAGSWTPIKNWACGTGAPSSPTVTGDYIISGRGEYFWGNMGGTPYYCYYYTQFYGDYLFHSYPCDPGTFNIQDSSNGPVSHGCVRLPLDQAKWIYDTIPYYTAVKLYY